MHAGARTSLLGTCLLSITLLSGCAPAEPPPSIDESATLSAQIAEHDGVDDVLRRFSAFVHGEPVQYWHIPGQGEHAAPLYRLCRPEGEDDCAALDHPPIVDLLPGDDGYSPFWQVHWVQLPEGWSGQITSVEQMRAVIASEGAAEPRSTSELMHCPIVASDVQIEVDDGVLQRAGGTLYVRDFAAHCLDFTATRAHHSVLPDGTLFIRNVYLLTREGESAPLSEPARMMDLNGDGDTQDSNNIFGVALSDADYTPLWRLVRVTVPAGLSSIDDGTPAYRSHSDMFDVAPDYTITPIDGKIVDYEITPTLINCPLQSAPGQL